MTKIVALLIALMALLPATSAIAEIYPSRPVHLIVPNAPGGSSDLLARELGDQLSKIWGQQVVIENKAGAGGIIGTQFAANAEPDGYTVYLITDGPMTIAPSLHRKPLPYDWRHDFVPISLMAVGYQILLSSPKLAAGNLKEFIDIARKNPNKYNYASIGVGSAPHLSAEHFLDVTGLHLTHVPYRGSSMQAITALMSGEVAMFMVGVSTAVPFVRSGTVRGLAMTSPRRLDNLPDVPTFAEQGWPQIDYNIWFGIGIQRGTPPDIVRKINADMATAAKDPEYQKLLHEQGFEAKASTPEQLKAVMEREYEKSKAIIERLGLQID